MRSRVVGTFAVALVFVACRSGAPPGMDEPPGMDAPPDTASGVCGDGVVQAESGEACDGTTDAVCASGVGHPRCTATCTVDDSTCGVAGDVVELAAAHDTPCTRDARGQIRCWGNNTHQQALAPSSGGLRSWAFGNVDGAISVVLVGADGRFESTVPGQRGLQASDLVQVATPSVISKHGVCGLRADGSIVCGLRFDGALPRPASDVWSPDPAFRAIQLFGSTDVLCAVSTASALTCWRYDRDAHVFAATAVSAVPVRAPLRALDLVGNMLASPIATWVDAGGAFSAADGLPAALMPPDDEWLAISIDGDPDSYGCGVTAANTVRCWGTFAETPSPLDVPGDLGTVTHVATFHKAACAVTRDHVMRCWGGGKGGLPPADRSDVVEIRATDWGHNRSAALRTTSDAIEFLWMLTFSGAPAATTRLYSPGAPGALLGDALQGLQCTRRAGGQQSCWGRTELQQGRAIDLFALSRNCQVLGDGTVSCTSNFGPELSFPSSLTGWTSLVVTSDYSAPLCGVDSLGLVSCVDRSDGQLVSVGALTHPRAVPSTVCGLTGDGARCAAVSGTAASYAAAGRFVDVVPVPRLGSSPALITLSPEGIVGCAGAGASGDPAVCARPALAAGRFRAIAEQCGVRDTGAVACWGNYPSPDELFGTTRVSAGLDFSDTGSQLLYAHGPDGVDRTVGPQRRELAMSLVDLRVGHHVSCGRDAGKVLHCFASSALPLDSVKQWVASIPQVAVDDYAVGPFEVCTVTAAGTRCYPGQGGIAPEIPEAVFRQVAVGRNDACGVTATGTATCWLIAAGLSALAFPDDTPALAEVTVGHDFACGLDRQGTAHCVQRPDSITLGHGRLALVSPVNDFTHLEAGVDHVCGLRRDGSIACFGSNLAGQSSPPSGTGYTSLASGGRYSCAARPGDRLRCWGVIWYE